MVKEIPERKARQGRLGSPVLMVLLGGLVLAMVVWGVVGIYGWMIAPDQPSGDPAVPVTEETAPLQPSDGG